MPLSDERLEYITARLTESDPGGETVLMPHWMYDQVYEPLKRDAMMLLEEVKRLRQENAELLRAVDSANEVTLHGLSTASVDALTPALWLVVWESVLPVLRWQARLRGYEWESVKGMSDED